MDTIVKNPYAFNAKGVYDYKGEADPADPYIFTIFLRDSALVVQEKIRANGNNGGHYYKRLNSVIYEVQTNRQGEKYLRVLRKTGSGVMLSVSVDEVAHSDRFLYSNKRSASSDPFPSASGRGPSTYCDEMVQLIENHLSKMLGFKVTHGPVPQIESPEAGQYSPDYLYYPFYREPSNKDFVQKFLIANKRPSSEFYEQRNTSKLPSTGSRGLHTALRHSKTHDDFVKNMVYKSYVKTAEDVKQIINSPHLLCLFSGIDLRVGAKEAVSRGLVYVFENYSDYMTASEFHSFKFLLPNLPKEDVSGVLKLVLQLAKFRVERGGHLHSDIKSLDMFNYGSSCAGNVAQLVKSFQQIAPKDRRKFAITFWEEFRKDYLRTEGKFIPHSEQIKENHKRVGRTSEEDFVKVSDVFMKAFAKTRLASIPDGAKERCVKFAMEFFGQDISQVNEATFQKAAVGELDVSLEYITFHGLGYSTNKNLLTLLTHNLETKKLFADSLIFSPIRHLLSNHLLDNSDGMLVSDLEQFLTKAVLKIDEGLLKIGQPLTPCNRMIYLQSTEKDRKFKINWKYYSLGVPPNEVSTYRVAGIRSKKDISFWVETRNSVPEEMYRELLNDFAYGSTKLDTNSMVSNF